jgi:membrane protease YdiL (CAAX protease family)
VRPGPLLLCLASSTAYAAASLIAATRWLGREDVLLGDRGGRHRRLRGDFLPDALLVFVVGMALLWFVAAPAQIASFTWGLGVTQFGLFAPLALLTPFLLGLGVRDTLGVRAPALGDLARGALLGALCPCIGFTVAEAQATFIPTSPAVNEMLQGMIPADLPFLVLFGLVAIAPGLCEELLFRGAILGLLDRSLRGRAGPILRHAQAIAIVVTAIAFGLFHTSLFRILPTAALGVVFGTARLRSRSIAVPMIAHMVNNGLLVGAGAAGVALGFQPALLLGFPAIAVLLWGMGRARGSAAPGVG